MIMNVAGVIGVVLGFCLGYYLTGVFFAWWDRSPVLTQKDYLAKFGLKQDIDGQIICEEPNQEEFE